MYRPALRLLSARTVGLSTRTAAVRGYASSASGQTFDWRDPLFSSNLLTEEEIDIAKTADAYCQERMLPRVLGKSV
jgi:hypothetical protein